MDGKTGWGQQGFCLNMEVKRQICPVLGCRKVWWVAGKLEGDARWRTLGMNREMNMETTINSVGGTPTLLYGLRRRRAGRRRVPLFSDMTRLRILCMLNLSRGEVPGFNFMTKLWRPRESAASFVFVGETGLGTNRPQDALEQVVPATFNHQWVAWRKAARRWSRSSWARDSRRRVEKASQVKEARIEPWMMAWRRVAES
jgi:hypothetical protein